MLFLQFMLYLSSFIGTLKNEISEAALELCQLKIKQLSPDILKFRTKHEDNHCTLNGSVVSRSFLFVFHAGSRGLGSNNFRNSSYKEKTAGSARVSRLSFRFLWPCWNSSLNHIPLKADCFTVFANASQSLIILSFILINLKCYILWFWCLSFWCSCKFFLNVL